jgi:hypothetical protein
MREKGLDEGQRRSFRIALDVIIILALCSNLVIYFNRRHSLRASRFAPSVPQKIQAIVQIPEVDVDLYLPQPPAELDYSESELQEAIRKLKLPTWSRSYVPCTDRRSEVTCSQIVRAWRVIKTWSDNLTATPITERRWITARHYYDGIGNRISIDVVLFLLCLMDNRTFVIRGFYLQEGQGKFQRGNAFEYDPTVLDWTQELDETINQTTQGFPFFVNVWSDWWGQNFEAAFGTKRLIDLATLIYSPMIYGHDQLGSYCLKHFGLHAVYFISNFFVRISSPTLNAAKSAMASVPRTVSVLGIHLRFQFPGQFYSYSVEQTMNVVVPFLIYKMNKKPTVFGFASDSKAMETEFVKRFGNITIKTNAIRKPDFDHVSAMVDMVFLEMCDECLLTFRSTFSFCVVSRMGKRCYYMEKEAPYVFQLGNSQSGSVSMLMHYWDVNDWQTSRRFHVIDKVERWQRFYFKYLML